jgi:hypothetical protein
MFHHIVRYCGQNMCRPESPKLKMKQQQGRSSLHIKTLVKEHSITHSRRTRPTDIEILLFLVRSSSQAVLKEVSQQKLLKLDGAWERRCV